MICLFLAGRYNRRVYLFRSRVMFLIALGNVLITLLYAAPGFALCKAKKVSAEHLSTLSVVLVYICGPCMIINSFLKMEFDLQMLGEMGLFFVITFVLQSVFMGIMWLILRKKFDDSKYRVLTIGAAMGNVGFFGMPIVSAMLPDSPEAMCYSAVYVFSMNILTFTIGTFCLTGDKKFISLKSAVLNPTTLGVVVAVPLYIFNVGEILDNNGFGILTDAIELVGKMTTPLCMIILGIRLATVSFSKLFMRPLVYLTCLLKLVVFPLFCYLAVYFLPLTFAFKASILILSSAPCASVILNLAEMHDGEKELAANSVLLTTLLCFITIPLLVLIL